jgi:ribosomal protein S18 acetylase RimI-like enzyme
MANLDLDAIRAGAERPQIADAAGAMAAARDLCDAFVEDPLFTWMSRTDARRDGGRLAFFRHLMKELALPNGQIQRPAAGGAAAVWMPSESMAQGNPIHKEILALPALMSLTGLARFPRLIDVRAALDKHHRMDIPHDYLFFLGVVPAAQGHGIGSRLLQAHTARLDAEGRAAHLETARMENVRLYQRFGFEVTAEFRIGKDGPLNWAMWRAPNA